MSDLKGLINGLDTMSAMRRSRYRLILERFARDMDSQLLNLRGICTNLLEKAMPITEIYRLINDETGELWVATAVQEVVRRKHDGQKGQSLRVNSVPLSRRLSGNEGFARPG